MWILGGVEIFLELWGLPPLARRCTLRAPVLGSRVEGLGIKVRGLGFGI